MNHLDADYWNNRFVQHDTPWDIGDVSTPLKAYIDQLPDKYISILVPGCGNGYEAEYLLLNGFNHVTVIDISPVLTEALEKRFEKFSGKELTIITGDFFAMKGQFDLALEQTFFCALDPLLRDTYVTQMQHLLKPGGTLAGLLFNKTFGHPGPPFGGSLAEYRQRFAALFRIDTLEACYNSVPARAGSECFFIMHRT